MFWPDFSLVTVPVLRMLSSVVRRCLARARQVSSTGTAIVCFREGQSSWSVCLLVIHLEDLLLRTVGDVSSDTGDGLADCAHLGLAPLDVDLPVFWSTTSNPL